MLALLSHSVPHLSSYVPNFLHATTLLKQGKDHHARLDSPPIFNTNSPNSRYTGFRLISHLFLADVFLRYLAFPKQAGPANVQQAFLSVGRMIEADACSDEKKRQWERHLLREPTKLYHGLLSLGLMRFNA